jgi:hypothetical protein
LKETGIEYLTVKALTTRPLTLEDDLKALIAQYTGDETTLELFQATKLSRYLPAKPLTPSPIEVAAYRYVAEIIGRLEPYSTRDATRVLAAYRNVLLAHDIELIIGRLRRKEELPSEEELILPQAPEVVKARRLAEEEARIEDILEAVGFKRASKAVARSAELISPALDLEITASFRDALAKVSVESAREIIGSRLDMTVARIAYSLASVEAPRGLIEFYIGEITSYKLPHKQLVEAIETRDREKLEAILRAAAPQALPEGLGVLEGYIASLRKHNRRLLSRAYIEAVLSPDILVPPLEQAMLDAEDAIAIAIAGFSRQPKHVVSLLISFTA